jgi:hypothetical protein
VGHWVYAPRDRHAAPAGVAVVCLCGYSKWWGVGCMAKGLTVSVRCGRPRHAHGAPDGRGLEAGD